MAQVSNTLITANTLDNADWRTKFMEVNTAPNDFVSAEYSIILSTSPFLPAGESFTDLPIYPVGLAQNFAWNEGVSGMMIPELGSSRKTNVAGSGMGSGSISRLMFHGNSLVAALYRPTLLWLQEAMNSDVLDVEQLVSPSTDTTWIKGLLASDVDLFSAELDDAVNQVIAAGGMNSLLFKLPFGLVEVKRDARKRVVSINYFEQCGLRGTQSGVSAGQFQIAESLSFEFERVRPLTAANNFVLSQEETIGI